MKIVVAQEEKEEKGAMIEELSPLLTPGTQRTPAWTDNWVTPGVCLKLLIYVRMATSAIKKSGGHVPINPIEVIWVCILLCIIIYILKL